MLRQQEQDRRQYRLICPCVPLCRAGGVVAGKGNIRRICPDFGRGEKGGVWSKHLQGRNLTEVKKLAGEKPALNCRQSPSNPRSAEIFCQRR